TILRRRVALDKKCVLQTRCANVRYTTCVEPDQRRTGQRSVNRARPLRQRPPDEPKNRRNCYRHADANREIYVLNHARCDGFRHVENVNNDNRNARRKRARKNSQWKLGFFWNRLVTNKNGRVPGIRWSAPTYVTELVGYLFRRGGRDFVSPPRSNF